MSTRALRTWLGVHKWSSLACTAFMLLVCLTGLPLIFYEEILELGGSLPRPHAVPADTPAADLDAIVAAAQARHPERRVRFVSNEGDESPYWFVALNESADADPELDNFVTVDPHTAQVLNEPRFDEGFMHVMYHLHADLFAGLPGKLFLGGMGLLLVVSLVSGAVVYGPFMRKLPFGTVRHERALRTRWLDLHNLLGIVTLAWALVIAGTGVINSWADVLFRAWQASELAAMGAPYRDTAPPARPGPVQPAVQAALATDPEWELDFVAFPGTPFSTPHHYAVYLRGASPLSARLLRPVLVDARTGQVIASRPLPWYLTALLVSRPLHFGDYGGIPLKVLWALLDLVTIAVLGSGVYLWLARGAGRLDARIAALQASGAP